VKKLLIILAVTIVLLSVIIFMSTQNIDEELIVDQDTQRSYEENLNLSVFDFNYCHNQDKIIGEMWFFLDEFTTVPVRATVNYEISSLDELIEEGIIKISPEDFGNWKLFGNEMYTYDFQIPVKNNVSGNNIILTVVLDNGNNLVYEDTIMHISSLDNCTFS